MNKLTVLLVDDHEGFINAAMRHFRKIDWLQIVGSAGNGLEAIERSESLRPQVVLMDLAMPEMGGLQATRLIKSQDDAPYIVSTASTRCAPAPTISSASCRTSRKSCRSWKASGRIDRE